MHRNSAASERERERTQRDRAQKRAAADIASAAAACAASKRVRESESEKRTFKWVASVRRSTFLHPTALESDSTSCLSHYQLG